MGETTRLFVGRLPELEGIWIYELDGHIFRKLARFRSQGAAERFRAHPHPIRRKDLKKGFDCEQEIEGFSTLDRRREINQKRTKD